MIATSGFLAALECTKFVSGRGFARTPLEELIALPRPLAGFRGPTSKGGVKGKGTKKGRGGTGPLKQIPGFALDRVT